MRNPDNLPTPVLFRVLVLLLKKPSSPLQLWAKLKSTVRTKQAIHMALDRGWKKKWLKRKTGKNLRDVTYSVTPAGKTALKNARSQFTALSKFK